MGKEISPRIKAQRKYEHTHKQERKERSRQYNTLLPREQYEEICEFLHTQISGKSI